MGASGNILKEQSDFKMNLNPHEKYPCSTIFPLGYRHVFASTRTAQPDRSCASFALAESVRVHLSDVSAAVRDPMSTRVCFD